MWCFQAQGHVALEPPPATLTACTSWATVPWSAEGSFLGATEPGGGEEAAAELGRGRRHSPGSTQRWQRSKHGHLLRARACAGTVHASF